MRAALHESHDTRARVLAAATALFAERGFHGTTVRDIATRAGVNVAAGNYHFGSKRDLYLEVLRGEFAEIRATLARRGASRPPEDLPKLSRRELIQLLEARARAMFEHILGPPPSVHGSLMQREMLDPSEALPIIVEEFMRPMLEELGDIVRHLQPDLTADQVDRCSFSILGQILVYRVCMPGILQYLGRDGYPADFPRDIAAHVSAFSVAGLARIATDEQKVRRGR